MHAAQSAAVFIKRSAALHQPGIELVLRKFMLAPSAREKAPRIREQFWLDDIGASERGLGEDHYSEQ